MTRGLLKYALLISLIVTLLVVSTVANMQGVPCVIRGTVTCDGSPVSGASISASPGGSTSSGGDGSYGVDASSGTSVTVTATYNGHSASISVSTPVDGGFVDGQNIAISTSGGGPSGGGGGTYYSPPAATPTPTPTPVPPYRLDTPLPSKVTISSVPVRIEGTQVSVPLGYLFSDVIKNNTFEAPITLIDGAAARLVITVEPSGSQTGTITSMHLIAEKTLNNSGQEIGVKVDISLADLPAGSSISFDLLSLDAVDINKVNEQLSAYSDRIFSPLPLLAFKATKNGLENGKDILGARLTFTVPRPAGFDPNATYYVVRENDGAYDILNATLISSPDADPLVFEVISPRGLSTFSVVRAEAKAPVITPVPPTPTPAPSPAPAGLSGGLTGILILLGTFTIGVVSGIAVLVLILWLRVR